MNRVFIVKDASDKVLGVFQNFDLAKASLELSYSKTLARFAYDYRVDKTSVTVTLDGMNTLFTIESEQVHNSVTHL